MNDSCILVEECPEVALDAFQPEILANCKGLPADMAQYYLNKAANKFCRQSKVLRQFLCLDLQACVCDVILEAKCGMEIVSIHKICDRDVVPFRPCLIPGCDGTSAWFVPPHSLTVNPAPQCDIEGALQVLVSVAPHIDSCAVPRELYERPGFRDAVIDGALAELFELQGTDFYNLRLAKEKRDRFEKAIGVAAMDRLLGYSMGPIKMRSRSRRYA